MSEKPERLLLNYLSKFTKDPVLKCKQFEIFRLDIRNNIVSFHSVQKSFCCDQRKRSVVSKDIILTFKILLRLPFFLSFIIVILQNLPVHAWRIILIWTHITGAIQYEKLYSSLFDFTLRNSCIWNLNILRFTLKNRYFSIMGKITVNFLQAVMITFPP